MSADRWDLLPPELAVDEEPFDVSALHDDEPSEIVAAWRVTGPETADWAMRRLAQAEAERKQLAEQASVWASKIERWYDQAVRKPLRSADFFRSHLEAYALAQREESGGKIKTITLPSGKISTRPGSGPKVRVGDPEAFKAWALDNPDHPAVRIKAELDAKEARARFDTLEAGDFQVVADNLTGEAMPWARIEPPSPPSATVTPS